MALIKCPECDKKMSDQASSCPHCGYTKERNETNKLNSFKKKGNSKYLLILLVVLIGGYFLFFYEKDNNNQNNDNPGTTPQTQLKPNANGNYEFNQNGKYFEFPTNYKVYISKDGSIYVGQNIDDEGALIPYLMIEKYKNYTSPETLLKDFTTALGQEYQDAKITIDLISSQIGDKYVYGMQFAYTSSGHLVIDNRYAFLVGNSMYLVTTKEENTNTDEINNVGRLIIESLKEVS